jgi:hypothetical protein
MICAYIKGSNLDEVEGYSSAQGTPYFSTCRNLYYFSKSSYKETAQRMAAQALGRIRISITILAGNLKPQLTIFSLSLGQVVCNRVLGGLFLYLFSSLIFF